MLAVLLVILGAIAWYGLGICGSSIGLNYFKNKYGIAKADIIFGYVMAILGPMNIIAALQFLDFLWLKGIKEV